MTIYPKVATVRPLSGKRLLVEFRNGTAKIYDCTPLLQMEAFKPLENESLFAMVEPEPHGCAVSWNELIDLAESELWLNGVDAALADPV